MTNNYIIEYELIITIQSRPVHMHKVHIHKIEK